MTSPLIPGKQRTVAPRSVSDRLLRVALALVLFGVACLLLFVGLCTVAVLWAVA